MASILSQIYSTDAMAQGYAFAPDLLIYVQPKARTHDEYLEYIRQLPLQQSPAVFGLHANASITKDLKEARETSRRSC